MVSVIEVFNMSSESEQKLAPVDDMKRQRKKKKPMSKEYMRECYHKHEDTYVCEHCERIYIYMLLLYFSIDPDLNL